MCFTIRHGKRLGETLKLPRLSRVSRASRFRPASRKLQRLVSVSAQKVSCTSLATSKIIVFDKASVDLWREWEIWESEPSTQFARQNVSLGSHFATILFWNWLNIDNFLKFRSVVWRCDWGVVSQFIDHLIANVPQITLMIYFFENYSQYSAPCALVWTIPGGA